MGVDWNRLRTAPPPSPSVWAFIPIHVCWAMGGTFWLPAAARIPANKPAVQVANWGRRPAGDRRGYRARAGAPRGPPGSSCVAVGADLDRVITKGLYLSGVHGAVNFPALPGVSAATAAAANHTSAVLDLAVFEPWFLIEGVLLLLAGRPSWNPRPAAEGPCRSSSAQR
jgi:hypothetical protein